MKGVYKIKYIFTLFIHDYGFWIRIPRKGFAGQNLNKRPYVRFSIRHGHTNAIKIKNWIFYQLNT